MSASRAASAREPVMLRAMLTPDEYRALRIAALNEGRAMREVAGDAIRMYVKQTRKGTK